MKTETIISTRKLEIGYPAGSGRTSSRSVASNIDVALKRGEVVGLLGPNGSGKSTLIRTLGGLLPPLCGDILLNGKDLLSYSAKERARKISTVLTDSPDIGNLNVYELVSFGRTPYTGWLGALETDDEKIIESAIRSTGLASFVNRDVLRLSDGERQKVMIARALAQDTSVVLLDEPTAHLDIPNRVEIIRLLRKLSLEMQKGILFSTHELDLALRAADSLWLVDRQGNVVTGTPEDLVLDGSFEAVFAGDSFRFDRSTGSFTLHQPSKEAVRVTGDGVAKYWTERALEREGYKTIKTKAEKGMCRVEVRERSEGFVWEVVNRGEGSRCSSVKEVISLLRRGKQPF